jgi:nitrile hydratase beta subunit
LTSDRDDFFAAVADDFLAAALADFLRAAGDDFLEVCLPALAGLRCAFFMPQKSIHTPRLVNRRGGIVRYFPDEEQIAMNSVHDIGGTDGFGPVRAQANEPVFHEPWEGRVFGMRLSGAGGLRFNTDAGRYQMEQMDPVEYLVSGYYERWLTRFEKALIESGTLTRDELEAKVRDLAANPNIPLPRRDDPAWAQRIADRLRTGAPASRPLRRQPLFAAGDRVTTRNLNPRGHTRLPRYARGKHGVIVRHHGAHVFPDSNALGLGENPQHLYSVRIPARELWGPDAEPNESLLIDLWESYLQRDRTALKSAAGISARGTSARKRRR